VSRYGVNKALRDMLLNPAVRQRFVGDPEADLAGRPFLTDQERAALRTVDYATLYGLGVHPFLLFGWTIRVRRPTDLRAFIQEYRAAVGPYGYPDFAT
jgi:hypothetical protein